MAVARDGEAHSRDAAEVARLLIEVGRRTALRGGNPFRAKAYYRAAESLLALPASLGDVIEAGELQRIPGVGPTIADIIQSIAATGTHPLLEKMRRETPPGLANIMALPGMRPERAGKLYRELGISSLSQLERVARAGELARVKGFGPAFQRKVLHGIDIHKEAAGRRHMHRAAALLQSAAAHLQRIHSGIDIKLAGDLRRGCELVGELSLVATLEIIKAHRLPKGMGTSGFISPTDAMQARHCYGRRVPSVICPCCESEHPSSA